MEVEIFIVLYLSCL